MDDATLVERLEGMKREDMQQDLSCFATGYLVLEARERGIEGFTQGLPPWMTLDYLMDSRNTVPHGVFRMLAQRIKDNAGNQSPDLIRDVAHRAVEFDDVVTSMVRRVGSIWAGLWTTTFLGNFITKDQYVNVKRIGREGKTVRGRAIHYFMEPMKELYYEQSTATRGYYEFLPLLWQRSVPGVQPMRVEQVVSRFSPEKLLNEDYAFAARALGIKDVTRDKEGKLCIDGEVYGLPVAEEEIVRAWGMDRTKIRYASKPIRMIKPVEFNGETILPKNAIFDGPASVYQWEYDKLPWYAGLRMVIAGVQERIGGTRHLKNALEEEKQQRMLAEKNRERAQKNYELAEEQRGLAEARAAEMQQLLYAQDHEVRGEGNVAVNELNRAEKRFGEFRTTLDNILGDLEQGIQSMIATSTTSGVDEGKLGEMFGPVILCYESLERVLSETTVGNVAMRISLARRRIEYVQSFLRNISFYSRVDINALGAEAPAGSFFEALEESIKMYNEDNVATAHRLGNEPELIMLNATREYDGPISVPHEAAQMIMYNLMRNSQELGTKKVDLTVTDNGERVTVHYRDYTGMPMSPAIAHAYERGEAPPSQGSHLGLGNRIIHRVVSTMGGTLRVAPETDGTSFFIQFKKVNDVRYTYA
ncbi:MAG: hypothetical protein Q7R76_04975 [Candidatus Woesearchaeota archaeon]|nr:hypothetical protein [Candidatus Woesearchaeota archaeon]